MKPFTIALLSLVLGGCVAPIAVKTATDQEVFDAAVMRRNPAAVEEFIRRHPMAKADLIRAGKIEVGMTVNEAQLALGWLEDVGKYTDARGELEKFIVRRPTDGGPRVLYFVNDKLISWQS